MQNKMPSAVVLCGGEGMRLRPLTKNIPKPLIKINNKPILYYIISHLLDSGIHDLYIATGYRSNKIEDFMNKEFKGVTYKIVNSGKVDLLKRIKDCANYIENDFIVCYGDTISNINIKKLIRFHKTNSKKITITAYPLKSSFGVINLNKYNSVIGFREKPVLNELINIGYFYFNHNHISLLNNRGNFLNFISYLVKNNILKSYIHKGIHITINTLAELEYANDNIAKLLK